MNDLNVKTKNSLQKAFILSLFGDHLNNGVQKIRD